MKVCQICGNQYEGIQCSRCAANTFTRQRRWRTGDRGGKRPERRVRQRTLRDALDGTWQNAKHGIKLNIDVEKNVYRSIHGHRKETSHTWRFDSEARPSISFYKDDMPVNGTVTDKGYLVLSARGWDLPFVYLYDGEMYRTCPCCYGKTPVEHLSCFECGWEFGLL